MKSVSFHSTTEQEQATSLAVAHLRQGGILGYPTETVYGLGCILEEAPLDALAKLKGGRAEKSFLLLVSGLAQVPHLQWTEAAHRLAAAFWPGPLTLALRADQTRYPPRVLSESGTVAIRQTSHDGIRRLIQALGQPITSTSANLPGQPPATDALELASLLKGLAAEDTLILDAGPLTPSPPSTLVDCSGPAPRLVREGAISVESLKRCVHDLRT
jgi:tRNA threonylcarbamoyl adenosine modification protein (Sua5/YciO/YrdC/YwlC family)